MQLFRIFVLVKFFIENLLSLIHICLLSGCELSFIETLENNTHNLLRNLWQLEWQNYVFDLDFFTYQFNFFSHMVALFFFNSFEAFLCLLFFYKNPQVYMLQIIFTRLLPLYSYYVLFMHNSCFYLVTFIIQYAKYSH